LNFVLCAKELLISYKADWDQRELKDPFELERFYELLDEMVIEARLPRSSFLSKTLPDIAPENILLEILDKQIRNTVTRFIKSKSDLNNEHLLPWLWRAKRIVKNEIIGDAANRADRKNEIDKYFDHFESSEEKSLTLVNRRLKADYDRALGKKKNEKTALLLIHDSAAEKAAKNYARKKGRGYNLNWRTPDENNLLDKLNYVYWTLLDWDDTPCFSFGQKANFIETALNTIPPAQIVKIEDEIGLSIHALLTKVKALVSKRHNLLAYLFGNLDNTGRPYKGRLLQRLLDLKKDINRRENRKKKFEKSQKEERVRCDHDGYHEMELNPEEQNFWKSWIESLPSEKQRQVAIMYIIEHIPVVKIAEKLEKNRRTIYKHLDNIKKHVKKNPEDYPHYNK
jgi:DNA-directed RNA polymerase specialized sigma24 family protein